MVTFLRGEKMSKSVLVAFSLIILLLLVVVGCEYQSVRPVQRSSHYQPVQRFQTDKERQLRNSCKWFDSREDFERCLLRAESGDKNAAYGIAEVYSGSMFIVLTNRTGIKKDQKAALKWYKVAADLGHKEATECVFKRYRDGLYIPANYAEAEKYLIKALNLGHEWAMSEMASRSEDSEPEKALELYSQLARLGKCVAQKKLSEIYLEGKIIPQDLCKSYFWALLANVAPDDGLERVMHGRRCKFSLSVIEKHLTPEDIQLVQNAASAWQKGQMEPDLPTVQTKQEEPSLVKIIPPDSIKVSKIQSKEKPIEWIPADIELNTQLKDALTPSEIFGLVNPSVWVVFSASTIENLKAMNNISQGSAIAINKNTLLTNYHVIDKRPYILIKHGEQFAAAVIYAGDKQSDRCILIVESIELKPVKGFMKYNQLSVGDTVYSIGSPQGLENSLGQGIVSGKREVDEQKIIQTTAHVSPGSSGGGLFDSYGNLIGITTFKVIDSEGLNFAIPVEDFTR